MSAPVQPVPYVPRTTAPPPALAEAQIQRLMEQGYTRGIASSLNDTKKAFARRIWIVDNSGSMQEADGHRLVDNGSRTLRFVDCSRWEEISECVSYHIKFADLLQAETRFTFLNHPGAHVGAQSFTIAASQQQQHQNQSAMMVQESLSLLRKVRPGGCTPLTSHILEIHREIKGMEPALRQSGQRVAIIIATDGLPTDEQGYGGHAHNQEFVDSLRLLEGLPVWLVIRLCTDSDDVVDFYNNLDSVLELSIDVLDDFMGEAKEIYDVNPWLNYGLPLHRSREMGYHERLFDLIDERPLTKSEIRDFCALLFGQEKFDGVPDPSIDWEGFLKSVNRLLSSEKGQWNPMEKKTTPWINVKVLNRIHGPSSCSIM